MSVEAITDSVFAPAMESGIPSSDREIQDCLSTAALTNKVVNQSCPLEDLKESDLKELAARLAPFILPSELQFNEEVDQKIRDIAQSKVFTNQEVKYPYGGVTYQFRIIKNLQQEPMHARGFPSVLRLAWALASPTEYVPFLLRNHVHSLVSSADGKGGRANANADGTFPDFPVIDDYEYLSDLKPVVMNVDGQLDEQFDAEIKAIFTSKDFVNKVLYYRIKGEDYVVRLIHNPEKLKLTVPATRLTNSWGQSYATLPWIDRYGLIIDKKAPKELLDRITKLANPSYWDFLMHFKVINGGSDSFWPVTYNTSWADFYGDLKK